MHVTLEQARALDALATHGTLQAAALALHKVHTAVLYAIKGLEAQSGLTLLDRSGYRTRLTAEGQAVLELCRRLLSAERALVDACAQMQSGWEPSLRIVYDGIFPAVPMLQLVGTLRAEGAPTRVQVSADHLDGVEQRFLSEDAHVMISVLPTRLERMRSLPLPRLTARLVAHRKHPLARMSDARSPRSPRGPRTSRTTAATRTSPAMFGPEELERHVLLTVRGSDPRLQLSTANVDVHSRVRLSDFHAKKAAILAGIGCGWLPEWLIGDELRRGELVTLPFAGGDTHAFEPRLYYREDAPPGRAGKRLLEALALAVVEPAHAKQKGRARA